jgi:hypothetical protein
MGNPIQVVADQIKEKYGTLRFYFSVDGEENDYQIQYSIIEDIINGAEAEAARTCEITGESGSLCKKGTWYNTLCRQSAKQHGYVASDAQIQKYWDSLEKYNNE